MNMVELIIKKVEPHALGNAGSIIKPVIGKLLTVEHDGEELKVRSMFGGKVGDYVRIDLDQESAQADGNYLELGVTPAAEYEAKQKGKEWV